MKVENIKNGEILWHVTVLSNFAKAYDKYARRYSKESIRESTFPDRFYLLQEEELGVGIKKANTLLNKLDIPDNRLLVLRTSFQVDELNENTTTGIGRYVEQNWISLQSVYWLNEDDSLELTSHEEVMAAALGLVSNSFYDFKDIVPRTFSVLPIARGCQASCPFCFSEASASAEQDQARIDLNLITHYSNEAAKQGAERFVITGGGEPGLVKHPLLCDLMKTGSLTLGKVVLITNAHHIARLKAEPRVKALKDYHEAGLKVLSISRHHYDDKVSENLMRLKTDVSSVANTWFKGLKQWPNLKLRFVCVLQKGGIDSLEKIKAYLDWSVENRVSEICFKELYLSTSIESVYHQHSANLWSNEHQIPLSLILEFVKQHNFKQTAELPWGAPIFTGIWKESPLKIAAYTEPSLLWERNNGVARSWNLMSDGRCLVSLEDRNSEINLRRHKE